MPEWHTNCILECDQQFQPLQKHRQSVKLELWCALAGQHCHPRNSPLPTRLLLTQVQLPRLWADVTIVVFRAEKRSPAKMDSSYNNKNEGPALLCTGLIGTGEHQQKCLWTISNQFAKDRDGRSASDCAFSLSYLRHRVSVTVGNPSLLITLMLHSSPYGNVFKSSSVEKHRSLSPS